MNFFTTGDKEVHRARLLHRYFMSSYGPTQRLSPLLRMTSSLFSEIFYSRNIFYFQNIFAGKTRVTLGTLLACHPRRGHFQEGWAARNWFPVMAAESTKRKDSMRVEKLSLLVLSLCIAVLVYVLVVHPF